MKKMKFVCIILTLLLVIGVFAGCNKDSGSSNESGETADDSQTSEEPAAENDEELVDTSAGKYDGVEGEKFKIGFTYTSFSEQLGGMFKKVIQYSADQFGCETVFVEWPTLDMEGAMEAHESLIESGCDGIISVILTPGMLESAEKAGIKVVQGGNILSDPDMIATAKASEYYVGAVAEDDYQAGYDMAKGLYESGSRNIAIVAPQPGMATSHDNRVRGVEDFVNEQSDLNLVISIRDSDEGGRLNSFRQAVTAYPDMDGAAVTMNDGEILGAVYADGLQEKIKVATVDIQEGTDQYLEDGTLAWIAGGQYPTMQIAFTMLYNSLTGHDVITDSSDFLFRNFMYITSAEEYADFQKYMEGNVPAYSGDELKDLCVSYNPDATLDLLKQYNKSYSLQDVVDRHKDLDLS
jgi:ribose transport system substrate-binding protein